MNSGCALYALLFVTFTVSSITSAFAAGTEQECNAKNSTCSTCVADENCYYCSDHSGCHYTTITSISTYFKHCSLNNARWKYCWLNVQAMIIGVSVTGIIALLTVVCFCCWCNRKCSKSARARRQRKYEKEEAEMDRQSSERRERNEERRAERNARNDEIRKKYGLKPRDDPPYEQIED